ncbi:hypothetical protein QE152_g39648 [Popillia japonica]|uniref:Uncharacterized protein n=1 Tax=Popillia japonica TaxID=7064 RepID=A0AAW1HU93_POPJA
MKKELSVPQSNVIHEYNRNMGGADLLDNGVANYRIKVVNAWKLYNMVNDSYVSQVDFQSYIASILLRGVMGTTSLSQGEDEESITETSPASTSKDIKESIERKGKHKLEARQGKKEENCNYTPNADRDKPENKTEKHPYTRLPPRNEEESIETLLTSNREEDEEGNSKYFEEALINGAYVDQGSKCVLLRRSEAERLNIKNQPIQHVDQVAKAVTEMFVVPYHVQQFPLLIGQPFTEQRHVSIVRRNTLRLFNEPMNKDEEDSDDLRAMNIPNLPKATVSLWAKYSVVIHPNHVVFVTLITDSKIPNDLLVEAHITTDKIIPRCIMRRDRNNKVQIPINNLTLTDIKIDTEEMMIRAGKCEENLHGNGTIMEVLDVEVRENCSDRTKKILTSCDIGTELDIS